MNMGHNSKGYFDGSTAERAVQSTQVKSLLDEMGAGVESVAEQYCTAIAFYCWEWEEIRAERMERGKMNDKMLANIMKVNHVLEPGCCPGHSGLIVDLELAGLLSEVE